jgi:putative RNA 2'-phosphotransferase
VSDDRAIRLSQIVSHALRHEPWVYELELDDVGWTPVEALLNGVRDLGGEWAGVGRPDLAAMLAAPGKRRHELDADGERIRALYGHSIPGRLAHTPALPPDVLFHGTSPRAWDAIRHEGLAPMGRQYVHLPVDVATAVSVGQRKSHAPLVLHVLAGDAHARGVPFFHGNDKVRLADHVPADDLALAQDTDA